MGWGVLRPHNNLHDKALGKKKNQWYPNWLLFVCNSLSRWGQDAINCWKHIHFRVWLEGREWGAAHQWDLKIPQKQEHLCLHWCWKEFYNCPCFSCKPAPKSLFYCKLNSKTSRNIWWDWEHRSPGGFSESSAVGVCLCIYVLTPVDITTAEHKEKIFWIRRLRCTYRSL